MSRHVVQLVHVAAERALRQEIRPHTCLLYTSGKEDLTEAQLRANIALISYLKDKYPTLTTVLGHYEQDKAKQTDLWREDVPNYYHGKIDPGPCLLYTSRCV